MLLPSVLLIGAYIVNMPVLRTHAKSDWHHSLHWLHRDGVCHGRSGRGGHRLVGVALLSIPAVGVVSYAGIDAAVIPPLRRSPLHLLLG